jgi:4-amino-4-deoxy-L-arabinose transferase-like glycosyltransferase
VTNRPRRAFTWLAELAVVVLALAIFALLTFRQIRFPGLHPDEALEVIPAIQLLRGQQVECFKGVCVEILGLRLPVMIYEYIATVNTYLAIPFFAVLGINVPALRTMAIAQSMAALVLLYLLGRDLFNRRVAVTALLLLAVSPSFVFWGRQGVFVTSVTVPISLAAVWAWLRWWRRGKSRDLYAGAALFGLGISAKFLFGWLVAAVGGAFLLLNADRLVACLRRRTLASLRIRLRWYELVIAGTLFLVGMLPLIVFNVRTQSTINYIRANLVSGSYYEVDNTRIGENLRERIKELRSVLNGETFWYLGIHPYASWRYPSVFLIALGVVAFATFGSQRRTLRQTLPGWGTVVAVVVPSYVALHFLRLHEPHWYRWLPGIALCSTGVTGLFLARGGGWRAWAKHLLTGLAAGALFMVFVYLAWKLAQWQIGGKVYAAGVLACVLAPGLRAREQARKVLFPALVIAVMLSASVFTPTALWFTHLAIMTPWPVLAIAAVADMVARRSGLDRLNLARLRRDDAWGGRAALSLGLLAVLCLGGMLIHDDLKVDTAYHRELQRVGGKGDHSNASYALAEYLQENGITKTAAMDWGIQDLVQFLSQGEINPSEIFGHENWQDVDPAFALRVRKQMEDPEVVYIFDIEPHFMNR